MNPLVVAFDFDGLIAKDNWPGIGYPNNGMIGLMRKLHRDGHKIIIFTCRAGKRLKEAELFLQYYGVPYDTINKDMDGLPVVKPYSDIYLDDRAIPSPLEYDADYLYCRIRSLSANIDISKTVLGHDLSTIKQEDKAWSKETVNTTSGFIRVLSDRVGLKHTI